MAERCENFQPGDFVHKTNRHRFQGFVVSVGKLPSSQRQTIVTVQHWPELWVFHFRAEQLRKAEPYTYDLRGEFQKGQTDDG